ncbi:DUF1676 domain-containing protein Osi14 [Rhynchophorus ferrugineus]|uniref:DUF1676 domain-containing protein Osi14 n=1 Tax=Rhynchophorus ferrugineus TaxID=354439 RepID=UPI003FCE90A4
MVDNRCSVIVQGPGVSTREQQCLLIVINPNRVNHFVMNQFVSLAFVLLALGSIVSGVPFPNNVEINTIPSETEFSADLNKCVLKDDVNEIAGCATERIVRSLDILTLKDNVEVLPGVSLLSDGTSNFRTGKQLSQELEEAKGSQTSMLELIAKSVSRFFAGRTLKVKLPDSETISRALVEGRKKMNKNKGGFMMSAMGIGAAAAALVPLFLGKVALIAAKALIVGKIALVLSGILLIQMFFGRGKNTASDSSGWSSAYREIAPVYGPPSAAYSPPSSGYGAPSAQYPYSRSLDVNNDDNIRYSQELAYSAQK